MMQAYRSALSSEANHDKRDAEVLAKKVGDMGAEFVDFGKDAVDYFKIQKSLLMLEYPDKDDNSAMAREQRKALVQKMEALQEKQSLKHAEGQKSRAMAEEEKARARRERRDAINVTR